MLKEVSQKTDCVNTHNPLDLSKREKYVWDVDRPLCKADSMGLDVSQTELIDELCPPGNCLGDFCRQVFWFIKDFFSFLFFFLFFPLAFLSLSIFLSL